MRTLASYTARGRSNAVQQTLGLGEIWGCHSDGGVHSSLMGQDSASRRDLLRSFVTSRMPQPADVFIMNVALATAHLKQAQRSELHDEQGIISLKRP